MFKRIIVKEIEKMESDILQAIKEVNNKKFDDTHKICPHCNITGHTRDMKEVWDYNGHFWYHNGCYAEKFNKHLCPCKCGKWIDNKKSN